MQLEQVQGGLPAELLNSDPNGFAWGVWHDRTPKLVAELRDRSPYGPAQRAALDSLLDEISDSAMQPLTAEAHDHELWMSWGKDYFGRPWPDAPFLWSESYFYRRLLDATGYFRPGPWNRVDPFEQMKTRELHDDELASDLAALDDLETLPVDEQGQAKLMSSLWGNRADLGFRFTNPAAAAAAVASADIVVNQSAQLWSQLHESADVIVVLDNAGRELVADLVLVDHLLRHDRARSVELHVKPEPYYVSDATTADVVGSLRRMAETPGATSGAAGRLIAEAAHGRLRLYTHDFYCAPWSYHQTPADLAAKFESSSLTVMKGDLNYRRVVGDRAWEPTTPFSDLAAYFPCPVGCLRTMKSDVAVGIEMNTLADLESGGDAWRVDGRHALVQVWASQ